MLPLAEHRRRLAWNETGNGGGSEERPLARAHGDRWRNHFSSEAASDEALAQTKNPNQTPDEPSTTCAQIRASTCAIRAVSGFRGSRTKAGGRVPNPRPPV